MAEAQEKNIAVPASIMTSGRPVACVQGIGFVGAAMAAAVASAKNAHGEPIFDVIGVDLPTDEGVRRITSMNEGRFPFASADVRLEETVRLARAQGNLFCTTDPEVYSLAKVILVDIPLDVDFDANPPTCRLEAYRKGIRTLGQFATPGVLMIVETTVPPGTTEKVVRPEIDAAARKRGLDPQAFLLAHSYERVMPGRDYLASIVNFWRVYAGETPAAADACEAFLSKIVNTREFPLRRLKCTAASETAKLLENSYRAATIALMEEWGRFAERVGIDLFEVIDAIRLRPTHSNMRQPGFGVGGYCLTKDPLFLEIGARELLDVGDLTFPFARLTIETNRVMPLATLNHLERELSGLSGRRILLLGVGYRQDVGDTRYSPSEVFALEAIKRGASVVFHDPLVESWPETGFAVERELPQAAGFDAIVFAIPHRQYREVDIEEWLAGNRPLILDANRVLSDSQGERVRELGCRMFCIGRGRVS